MNEPGILWAFQAVLSSHVQLPGVPGSSVIIAGGQRRINSITQTSLSSLAMVKNSLRPSVSNSERRG
jgi:hypothetical protein